MFASTSQLTGEPLSESSMLASSLLPMIFCQPYRCELLDRTYGPNTAAVDKFRSDMRTSGCREQYQILNSLLASACDGEGQSAWENNAHKRGFSSLALLLTYSANPSEKSSSFNHLLTIEEDSSMRSLYLSSTSHVLCRADAKRTTFPRAWPNSS